MDSRKQKTARMRAGILIAVLACLVGLVAALLASSSSDDVQTTLPPASNLAATGGDEAYEDEVGASYEQAVLDARAAMIDERAAKIEFTVLGDGENVTASRFYDDVVEHTGDPRGGDYLDSCVYYTTLGKTVVEAGGRTTCDCVFRVTYRGPAVTQAKRLEREEQVDARVAEALAEIEPAGKDDYDCIEAAFDWVCDNVEYAADGGSGGSSLVHTAYGGLVNGECVCDGYSSIMYRLLLEMGIDCRCISGSGRSTSHSWNIAEICGKYYDLDACWGGSASGKSKYFLKDDASFPDHTRYYPYNTDDFYEAYPMASRPYVRFADVTCDEDWYYEPVYRMAERGYVTGYADAGGTTIFNHGGAMDRAQAATVLWRMAGEPDAESGRVFADCDYGDYYGDAVDWAWEAGVVTGYDDADGNLVFDPSGKLDFEALVTMCARFAVGYDAAASWPQDSLRSSKFSDADDVSDWARGPAAWAVDEGVVTGSGEGAGAYRIDPASATARGRGATVLQRTADLCDGRA